MSRSRPQTAAYLVLGATALGFLLAVSGVALSFSVILAIVAFALALRVWGYVVLRGRSR